MCKFIPRNEGFYETMRVFLQLILHETRVIRIRKQDESLQKRGGANDDVQDETGSDSSAMLNPTCARDVFGHRLDSFWTRVDLRIFHRSTGPFEHRAIPMVAVEGHSYGMLSVDVQVSWVVVAMPIRFVLILWMPMLETRRNW